MDACVYRIGRRTLGGARGEHEVDLGDETQREAEARDYGADAVDEPLEGGVVHVLEERHEPEDEAWLVWLGCNGWVGQSTFHRLDRPGCQ